MIQFEEGISLVELQTAQLSQDVVDIQPKQCIGVSKLSKPQAVNVNGASSALIVYSTSHDGYVRTISQEFGSHKSVDCNLSEIEGIQVVDVLTAQKKESDSSTVPEPGDEPLEDEDFDSHLLAVLGKHKFDDNRVIRMYSVRCSKSEVNCTLLFSRLLDSEPLQSYKFFNGNAKFLVITSRAISLIDTTSGDLESLPNNAEIADVCSAGADRLIGVSTTGQFHGFINGKWEAIGTMSLPQQASINSVLSVNIVDNVFVVGTTSGLILYDSKTHQPQVLSITDASFQIALIHKAARGVYMILARADTDLVYVACLRQRASGRYILRSISVLHLPMSFKSLAVAGNLYGVEAKAFDLHIFHESGLDIIPVGNSVFSSNKVRVVMKASDFASVPEEVTLEDDAPDATKQSSTDTSADGNPITPVSLAQGTTGVQTALSAQSTPQKSKKVRKRTGQRFDSPDVEMPPGTDGNLNANNNRSNIDLPRAVADYIKDSGFINKVTRAISIQLVRSGKFVEMEAYQLEIKNLRMKIHKLEGIIEELQRPMSESSLSASEGMSATSEGAGGISEAEEESEGEDDHDSHRQHTASPAHLDNVVQPDNNEIEDKEGTEEEQSIKQVELEEQGAEEEYEAYREGLEEGDVTEESDANEGASELGSAENEYKESEEEEENVDPSKEQSDTAKVTLKGALAAWAQDPTSEDKFFTLDNNFSLLDFRPGGNPSVNPQIAILTALASAATLLQCQKNAEDSVRDRTLRWLSGLLKLLSNMELREADYLKGVLMKIRTRLEGIEGTRKIVSMLDLKLDDL